MISKVDTVVAAIAVEAKYEAQVRRTEEIQMHSQEKILELQRMTTIGQPTSLPQLCNTLV